MDYSHLKQIRGWLIFIFMGLLFNLVLYALSLYNSMTLFQTETWHPIGTNHPLVAAWIIYETAFNFIMAILIIYILVLMIRKSPLFPKLMIYYLLSAVIFQDYAFSVTKSEVLGYGVIWALVQAAIGVPYFIKSKRVKATFLTKIQNSV